MLKSKAKHGTEVALLTFHRKARLPLQLGRIPAELIVRAKDQGDIGCLGLATGLEPGLQKRVRTAVHATEPVPGRNVGEVARVEIQVRRQAELKSCANLPCP